jgi:CubicO group peptidase (beta-lactamase class C family)
MRKFEQTDDPKDLGLDPARLTQADRLLATWTERGDPPMPGAAYLVGRRHRYLTPRFFGKQGPESSAPPIRRDGIFLIASITKPVVYLAALQLIERGELTLGDPVVRFIPEFAANHKDGVRIIHLMTHTSGMPDMLPNDIALRQAHAPMERFIKEAIEVAPLFQPGADHSYQSMGTLITAEIIQRISGMKIRDYLHKHIFEPLGLRATALGSDGLDAARLVRVETRYGPEAADWDWNSDFWRRFGAPWGGMFTTPEDFAHLCHAILAGTDAPVQILAPNTIQAMRTNHIAMMRDLPERVVRSQRWGLGWKLNTTDGSSDEFCDLLGPDVFGHTGATGTMAWLDPISGLFCIIFTTGVREKAPWRQVAISNIIAAAMQR